MRFHCSAVLFLCGSVLFVSSSCSNGGAGGAAPSVMDDATATDGGPFSAASANGDLRIVSVDLVGDHVTDGDNGATIRLEALVSDRKGSNFISGGDIRGASGKLAVPFESKGNGRFVATLGWSEIAHVESISFTAPEGTASVVVKFVDGDANEATVTVPIPLRCSAATYSACSGVCTAPLEIDRNNCGRCGHQCKTSTCTESQCLSLEQSYSHSATSCKDVCAIRGTVCANTCSYDLNGVKKQILGYLTYDTSEGHDEFLTDCNSRPSVPAGATNLLEFCCCADP